MKPVIVLIASVSLLLPGCTSSGNKKTAVHERVDRIPEPDKNLRAVYEKSMREQRADTINKIPID